MGQLRHGNLLPMLGRGDRGGSNLNTESLTGVWQGFFSYPRALGPVQFTATLIETGSWITGTTHEPCDIGEHQGETLYATLSGSRDGTSVTFDKTYDGSGGRTHTIHYEGMLSEDGIEVEGRWIISRILGRAVSDDPFGSHRTGRESEGAGEGLDAANICVMTLARSVYTLR